MRLLDAPDFFGYTIFCDDIRREADGKMIFVGVYIGQMLVNIPFPVTLPKFGFSISFWQKKELFVPKLGIRIFLPGDSDDSPSITAEMSEAQGGAALEFAAQPPSWAQNDPTMVTLYANLIFVPLPIKQQGTIKVRIVRNDELIRVGSLWVTPAQPEAAPSPTSP